MPSFAMIALDWMDTHPEATQPQRFNLYSEIRPEQFATHFEELSSKCPSRRSIPLERRPANALNLEIGQAMDRCMEKSPDGRGAAWALSGGSLLAYGKCGSCSTCPRTKVGA